jgi:hypothetical protein
MKPRAASSLAAKFKLAALKVEDLIDSRSSS